jgi:hypothetical protein
MSRSHSLAPLTLTLLLLAPLGAAGCSKKPCDGGGMIVDDRPLEGAMKDIIGPAGGVMCRAETDDGKYQATSRMYELLEKTPDQAALAWDEHMKAKGWELVTPFDVLADNLEAAVRDKDKCGVIDQWYAKPGEPARVHVTVSFCVDKGWSSITTLACDDEHPSSECLYGAEG